MSIQIDSGDHWSDELGGRLLSSVPDEYLMAQWGSGSSTLGAAAGAAPPELRDELVTWARQDAEVRRWLLRTWRHAHPDVVAAADHTVTEGMTSNSVQLLNQFEAVDVLLAFLTDEFEDGCKLAHSFINQVSSVNQPQSVRTRPAPRRSVSWSRRILNAEF